MIRLFLELLNNTFLGTLLAGTLLALFGLFLYRTQKDIDIRYDDHKKIRELASLLFAHIEIAVKDFRGQLNIYDGKNPQVKIISDTLNSKFNNYFHDDSQRRFNQYIAEVEKSLNNLVAQLKLNGKDIYLGEINSLTEKMPMLHVYLLSTSVMGNFSRQEIDALKKGFEETILVINTTLQGLMKPKSRNLKK